MASKNSIRDAFREQIPGPEATSAYVRALQEIAAELTNMASSIDEGLENITNPISVSTEESNSRISKSSRVIRAYNSACGEYSNRRNRDNLFDPSLFGEASWDILLFMYINHVKREAVTVSMVCAGSCVPQTTALRYIDMLEARRLIEKERSDSDNRVVYVKLAALAFDKLTSLLDR